MYEGCGKCYNDDMEIPMKRLKSGFGLPELGLGTLQMGGKDAPDASSGIICDFYYGSWLNHF